MTEVELFNALRPLYPEQEYALLAQVADGTGSYKRRHADAVAVGLWPSRGMYISGFEMKSYRGDWLREKKAPEKAEPVARFCHFWWIVTSGPFVKPDELPHDWGLMSWDPEKSSLVKLKPAVFRNPEEVTLSFVASVLRSAQRVSTPDAVVAEAATKAYAKGHAEGMEAAKYEHEQYEKLKASIKEFERASGVTINQWNAGDIGDAVNQVVNGTIERGRSQLLSIATRLVKDLSREESEHPHTKV